MKFAVVLHGPEVIDTGLARKVIGLLSNEGRIEAVMSGYTGVAAVIDAGLEDQIDITRMRKPSKELARLNHRNDILLLVNFAKSTESSLSFGRTVFSRCKRDVDKPLLQVDDGILIDWNEKEQHISGLLAHELGLELLKGSDLVEDPENDEGGRRVRGVIPGENLWVDGVVVGRATSSDVVLRQGPDGRLRADGVELKVTGVNRLGQFSPQRAHVRSGLTRRTKAVARAISSSKNGVFFIDHSAEEAIYRCREASLVVTVGDDTSKIAGSLLYRFNVPIVAITDGDEDGISSEELKTEGSVVVRVRAGTDDIVGREVRQKIFRDRNRIEGRMTPLDMAKEVMLIAGDRLEWHRVCG
ncbi:MAG: DUF2117 domain-containing protein [Methanomassiliicoccales archaeon]|nr:DUF2117 domain-containing protein [Methanomassiliicoccales archaeon]MDD1756905.1 DUF2117 domain-containing protein [Methanomassiliicoccales archaeon]